jgi:multidrug resistance efflux pump
MLIALFDGVVSEINAAEGDFASPGVIVAVVSDMGNLQIETTDLSERDISKVKVGNPAVILVKALNQEFDGKVVSISPVAQTLGGDVVYKVTIAFDERPDGVLGGMSADVTISE